MDVIVYDVEMTNHLSEIIEIGAVRLTNQSGDLELADTFQTFVNPVMDTLDKKIVRLTGITNENLQYAPSFVEAAQEFEQWIGKRDYFLCSWGPEDKWAFINDALYHRHPISWLINHNDIQLLFSMLYESERGFRYGLTRALTKMQLTFDGKQHRALDDAKNTAKILKAIYNKITLKKDLYSYKQSHLLAKNQVVYQTEDDDTVSPFDQLKQLLNL